MKPLLRISLVFIVSVFYSCRAQAQQDLVYSHYFLNPFLYNPSFVAPNGYTELYLNYRNQWAGIEGAPVTGTVSIHLPLNYRAGIAFTGYQDKAGVLKTSTGLLTFAYQVYLGNKIGDDHKLAFGLSAGMTSISVNADDLYSNDPVTGTTSSFEGQFGMHYQRKNFKIAFAIPRLFRTYVASEQDLNKVGIEQIRTTISSVSYKIPFSSRIIFEPMITYRTYENTSSQVEGLGVLHINSIAWVGGSYRQKYGATGFVGFNVKEKLKLGYAYEFAPQQANALGDGTHELQLIVQLGKKKLRKATSKLKGKVSTQPEPVEPGVTDNSYPNEDIADNKTTSPRESSHEPSVKQQIAKQSEPTSVANAPVNDPVKEEVKSLSGNELPAGHYVVVGAFRSVVNAKSYARTLKRAGYPADIAFHPEKQYYIVHLNNAPTVDEARVLRDKYRQMSRYTFRDTWILSIP
ncbi:PorP/SprF family type IX secretion system membrane protein [Ohtaekwangia kribbensis]|jgi:type IX secretion system PorP/SprF family membrane protein|uniref:PorP/SprF family type IX secretion system membrane protein n=1 Tax=Ohtaekwangia kribbensis TaxID=688913 RepID=A0ABW3K2S5_9BACT